MSIHPEGKPCSDIGGVLVLHDPATRPGEMHHALSELVMRRLPNASLSATKGVSKSFRDAAAGGRHFLRST